VLASFLLLSPPFSFFMFEVSSGQILFSTFAQSWNGVWFWSVRDWEALWVFFFQRKSSPIDLWLWVQRMRQWKWTWVSGLWTDDQNHYFDFKITNANS
jgi:hypothetical protein